MADVGYALVDPQFNVGKQMLPVFQHNTHTSLSHTATHPNLKLSDSRAQLGGYLLGQSMIPVVTTVLPPTGCNAHFSGAMTVSVSDW